MILEIPRLLGTALPERFAGKRLSVAAIYTTRPKYLVFGDDRERPLCVVDIGSADEARRRFAVLQRLFAIIPQLTAEPIGCLPYDGGDALLVQGGLAGIPWFALGRAFHTRGEWQTVIERSVEALRAFGAAVASVPGWSRVVAPGDELRRQLDLAAMRGVPLSGATRALVAARARALDACGETPYRWQHGDFSLNNLLIDRDAIGIIDLEDLGSTSVPLHDEIGLALSIRLSNPQAPLSTAECLETCVAAAARRQGFDAAQAEGLLLHHLLWRINECVRSSRRQRLSEFLLAYLTEVTVGARAAAPAPSGLEQCSDQHAHA